MNSSSDAAESMVKMTLEGTQVALKITGSAAKNVTAILMALSKNKIRTKGKTSLGNMLKSGKELKVFSLRQDDLNKFVKAAKKYGVLYHVLIDKKQSKKDGMVDILVRGEDAAKINRIFERFNLSSLDRATVNPKEEKHNVKADNISKNTKSKETVDKINPKKRTSEKSPPFDISSIYSKEGSKRVSVREKINKIKQELALRDKSKKKQKKHIINKSKGKTK